MSPRWRRNYAITRYDTAFSFFAAFSIIPVTSPKLSAVVYIYAAASYCPILIYDICRRLFLFTDNYYSAARAVAAQFHTLEMIHYFSFFRRGASISQISESAPPVGHTSPLFEFYSSYYSGPPLLHTASRQRANASSQMPPIYTRIA